ncbi:MAG: hypothetical protein WC863_04575 [Patescibacteria group bacterium]
MDPQSALFSIVPEIKSYGQYGGKYLLSLIFQEPKAIPSLSRDKHLKEKIANIIAIGENPETSIFCPVCRRHKVSYFILPDLNNFSPCFRQTCCGLEKCQKKLLKTFQAKEENLLPFSLGTLFLFQDDSERFIICKFFREVFEISKNIGGIEFINQCQEIFCPSQELPEEVAG